MAESLDDIRKKSREDSETKDAVDSNTKDSTSVDDGGIPECAVCLQTCVHPCRLPCGHIFCFLCIKGTVATTHPGSIRRCAMCRREIPSDFLEKPTLLRPIFPTPAIAPNPPANGTRGASNSDLTNAPPSDDHEGYQWFYEGRNGWWQYDERTGKQLEAAYSSGEVSCEMMICGSLYVIDFENLVQYRKVGIGRRRKIKRDIASAEKKGIAGWWQYDERTSLELEGAYKRGERSCELLIAGFLYVADFDGMVQLRRGDPSRRRRIKRDLASIPVKGVAGLRQRAPVPVEEDEDTPVDLSCYFQQDASDERSAVIRTGRFRNQPHLIQIPPTPANTPGNTSPGVPQTPGTTTIPAIIGNVYPEASLRHVVEEMGRLRLGETRVCVRHGASESEEREGGDEDEEVTANVRTSSVLWSPVSPDIASASPWVLTLSSDEDQL